MTNIHRALFVGVVGSSHIYLLRLMKDREDPWFDSKVSSDFNQVVYYLADVFPQDNGEDLYVLDSTAENLKHLGHNLYHSDVLGRPEMPLEMRELNKNTENERNSRRGEGVHAWNTSLSGKTER